jgi:hypothetical protein
LPGTAIGEFDKKPQCSIIHSSTAVKLFLKAGLPKEHYALIEDDRPGEQGAETGWGYVI